jgi:RNA polymerase sigma-70 factor, ECF subfamily
VTSDPAQLFLEHRSLLFGIAYRLLGSAAEAEDAVQETWLKWSREGRDGVQSAKGWLVAAITRHCIDELRSARRKRETYKGPWLPEPIVDESVKAPREQAALSDSLSFAFLLMLEELSPAERAVYVLREAFDYDYEEIAGIVGKSEASCRQLLSRARRAMGSRHPREEETPAEAERIVKRFLEACATGDVTELMAVLTGDAVLYTDGGGKVRSALRPVQTSDRIARFFAGISRRVLPATHRVVAVNGRIGIFSRDQKGGIYVTTFRFAADRIAAIYRVSNPDKLAHLQSR